MESLMFIADLAAMVALVYWSVRMETSAQSGESPDGRD
jgi:hypothetical protein